MSVRKRRVWRWIKWILLSLLLLPVLFLLAIRVTGSMKMRKSDQQILEAIRNPAVEKSIAGITSGDRIITYLRTSQSNQKDAILFIHGSPGSMDAFLRYMGHDSLLKLADLITYDRPGYGHSGFGHTAGSLQEQVKHLKCLMDSLAYDRYWLIGHSYGGPIILQAAMSMPDRIAGLAIIAGSVIEVLEPKSPWRKWIDFPLIKELLPTVLRVSNQELMTLRRDLASPAFDWDKVTVPVTLLHGTKDVLVPVENMYLARERLVNSDSVRIREFDRENHFIVWTHKEQVVEMIVDMVRQGGD